MNLIKHSVRNSYFGGRYTESIKTDQYDKYSHTESYDSKNIAKKKRMYES